MEFRLSKEACRTCGHRCESLDCHHCGSDAMLEGGKLCIDCASAETDAFFRSLQEVAP